MACRIYSSLHPPVKIPTDLSISQFLERYNPDDTPADKIIISDFHDFSKHLTYGGLRTQSARGAAGLKALCGLEQGSVVCILAENCSTWVLLAHSVLWAGGCLR